MTVCQKHWFDNPEMENNPQPGRSKRWPARREKERKSAVNQRGQEKKGPPDVAPKSFSQKRANMVFCPFHRSHREICTRNRPLSETKFLDDLWRPLSLPAPLFYCRGKEKDQTPSGPLVSLFFAPVQLGAVFIRFSISPMSDLWPSSMPYRPDIIPLDGRKRAF